MTQLTQVSCVLALLGTGIVAGVLFAVALSTVPALAAMPPEHFVYTHTLLGKNWDPVMPVIVLSSTLLEVGLALTTSAPAGRTLFAIAAACLLGVSVVSHFRNVPINRQVHRTDPRAIPLDWQDPRALWRSWHLLRTWLAVAALVATSIAGTLIG
jgi:uncharacterized membrane protein